MTKRNHYYGGSTILYSDVPTWVNNQAKINAAAILRTVEQLKADEAAIKERYIFNVRMESWDRDLENKGKQTPKEVLKKRVAEERSKLRSTEKHAVETARQAGFNLYFKGNGIARKAYIRRIGVDMFVALDAHRIVRETLINYFLETHQEKQGRLFGLVFEQARTK